jgi:SAM-dependent methyltransferase
MTPGFNRTIDICRERVPINDGTLLLDVPCGKGEAIARLAASGCHAVGVDYSPELLECAAAKIGDRALLLRADGGRMPLPDDASDVVLSIGGPSCIGGHTFASAIAEQARVLKPGGFLVMSDMFRDESDPNPWITADHPDASGWWQLLEDAGLDVVYFEHFDISAWDEYHAPMRELVTEARESREPDRTAWADEVDREIASDLPKGAWANYGTFIAQKS